MEACVLDLGDIHPLTDFLRNTKAYTRKLKKTGRPAVLTINGEAELVVQDSDSYQELLEAKRQLEDLKAVQQALMRAKAGKGIPFEPFAARMEAKYPLKKLKQKRAK